MDARPRILLVDDEPSLVKIVQKRLEVEGYEVSVAMDGEEALKKAQAQFPELIILDVMLPKFNGYEVCRRLKQDVKYQKIPIVMFTARVQEKDEKLGMESGAEAYIRKPFRATELLDKIKELLEKSKNNNKAV